MLAFDSIAPFFPSCFCFKSTADQPALGSRTVVYYALFFPQGAELNVGAAVSSSGLSFFMNTN